MRFYSRYVPASRQRLLDLGCGNGYSVPAWAAVGVSAVGVDVSPYRLGRWIAEHRQRRPLVLADARSLPFRAGAFDLIVSSGMIEHVGVVESAAPYTVTATPDQDSSRARVVAELARTLRPAGTSFLDFPNGSFPVDFWHGDELAAVRWHSWPDALLPTFADVARWAAAAGLAARLEPLGGRLAFRQIGRRWWGRWLAGPAAVFIRCLDGLTARGARRLRARCYPYLVISLAPSALTRRRGR